MIESLARVPFYPLSLPIFWGAFGIFLLVVWRHVRVWAAVAAEESRAGHDVARRLGGVVRYTILQTRMFREGRVGLMHYGLFLGSTVLLIGNINVVLGGVPEAVVSAPVRRRDLAGTGRAPERGRGARPGRGGVRVRAAPGQPAAATPVHADGAPDPGDDRARRLDRVRGPVVRGGPLRRRARGVHLEHGRARPSPARRRHHWHRLRPAVVGPYRGPRDVPRVHPLQPPLPRLHELRERLPAQARATWPAADDGPRARGRHLRGQDPRRPRLEGRPRRLRLHRVRPLHRRLSRARHRQDARPAGAGHGHPRPGDRGGAKPQLHPELAARARARRRPRRLAPRDGPGRSHSSTA